MVLKNKIALGLQSDRAIKIKLTMYKAITVPNGKNILLNRIDCPTFVAATLTNFFNKCRLKSRYYKVMPGSTFVDLVSVAAFQPHLRRAVLFCQFPILSYIKSATFMNQQQPPTQEEILRQLLQATKDQLLKVSFYNQNTSAPTVTFSANPLNVVAYAN